MFVFKQLFYISFSLSCLWMWGCTAVQEKEGTADVASVYAKESVDKIVDDLVVTGNRGIHIAGLQIDTMIFFHEAEGIKLSFDISISQDAIDSAAKAGFNGYYINLLCETDNGLRYTSLHEVDKSQRIHVNRDRFISSAGERHIEFQFPYRGLEMKKGKHEVSITIQALGINFTSDSASRDFEYIRQISPTASITASTKVTVNAPQLFKTIIEVVTFKMNTAVVDPQKYDFSVGGSGLPDLYWSMYCGADLIYNSPSQKNTIKYCKKYKSKPFYCSKDDVIKINVADFDNGPFNTEDDIVETWSGRITELRRNHADTFAFGKLEYFVMKAEVLE